MSVAFEQEHETAFFSQPTQAKEKSLLRFITCGSVDDGKSTLIGRLLHDTGNVFDDQVEDFARDSKKFGTTGGDLDFALLVDGLSAEREQGITIDVAYRYFSSPKRNFIIADTPGHEQYTRNMATGASQADLAIILIDARKGVLPQTKRHSFITSLVGVRCVIVAVNKMDLVDFDEQVFQRIEREYRELLPKLDFRDVRFIPVSAKLGANVVTRAQQMPWYAGATLLETLEEASPPDFDRGQSPFHFPVQWVNRPNLDFRGYSGSVASGEVKIGDGVISLPSGARSRIKQIYNPDGLTTRAGRNEAVTVTLEDEIDTSRGDVLVGMDSAALPIKAVRADILWMATQELNLGKRFLVKLATMESAASIAKLEEKIDIHSYSAKPAQTLLMNEIGQVTLGFEKPLVALPYQQSRKLGAFILIDAQSHETLALGVVRACFSQLPRDEEQQKFSSPLLTLVGKLSQIWLGSPTKNTKEIIALRLLASSLLAFIAWGFGSSFIGVGAIWAADFFLRPFLRLVLRSKNTVLGDNWEDGAGI